MKKLLTILLFFVCLYGIAAAKVPKTGGLAFRFDDNQTTARWRDMGAIFEANGFRMSMALNFGRIKPDDREYLLTIRNLQQAGHEIMDHTPEHAVFRLRLDEKSAAGLAQHPAIDHRSGATLYFKYQVKEDKLGEAFKADVDGKKLAFPAELEESLKKEWIIYSPELRTAFMTVKVEDGYELRSFWDENNIDLGRRPELEFRIAPRAWAFAVEPAGLRLMAEYVRDRSKDFGLTPPVTWIQPGSREPIILAEEVRAVYGDEFGYVSGATYQNAAAKVYCEPEPERCRFAMQWGEFNLEKHTADQAKKIIADRVAKNHVLTGSGHMWVHLVDGGLEEYLKRHRELLQWCRETGIAVRTQSQWADLLYGSTTDPAYNIMPKLEIDRDGDGVPDGYRLGQGVSVKGDSLISSGPGRIFRIEHLAGMERGDNQFRFTVENGRSEELKIVLDLVTPQRESSRVILPVQLNDKDIQKVAVTVTIPDNTVFMHLDVVRGNSATGDLQIRDLSFAQD